MNAKATTKKQVHRLTTQQYIKVYEWLKLNHAQAESIEHAAKMATVALGFTVGRNQIVEAEEAAGVIVKRTQGARNKAEKKNSVTVIAQALVTLLEKMGEPVPAELTEIAKK